MSDCEDRQPRQHAKTVSIKRLSKRQLERGRLEANADLEGIEFTRPKTRGDCAPLLKPCPNCGVVNAMRISSGNDENDRSDGPKDQYADGCEENGSSKTRVGHMPAVALPVRVRKDKRDQGANAEERESKELRLPAQAPRDVRNAGILGVELDDLALLGSEQQGLRRQGYLGLRGVEKLPGVLRGHGTAPEREAFTRQNQQQRRVRPGELQVGAAEGAGEEQTKLSCPNCGQRVVYVGGVGGEDWHWENHDPRKDQARVVRGKGDRDTSSILNGCRPCPFSGCKHHLYLDISAKTGSLKHNFPHLEVWDLPESCALDIADRQGIALEEVGVVMNITRERVRQLENRGLGKLKALNDICGWADLDEKQEGIRDCTTDNDREHVRRYTAKANEAPRPTSAAQLTEFLAWLERNRADLA